MDFLSKRFYIDKPYGEYTPEGHTLIYVVGETLPIGHLEGPVMHQYKHFYEKTQTGYSYHHTRDEVSYRVFSLCQQ